MKPEHKLSPDAWRSQYKKTHRADDAIWQLAPASGVADMKVTGVWQGSRFELFSSAQQVLAQTSTAVTPEVFSTLPAPMKQLLLQSQCEQWFSLVGEATPDVSEVTLSDALPFDSQLVCQYGEDGEYSTWFFNADTPESLPLLSALLPHWPEVEVLDQPRSPSVLRFIAGIQPFSEDELASIHTGALLQQGYIFYPSLVAAVCTYQETAVLPASVTLMTRSESGIFHDEADIDISQLESGNPWLVYEIANITLSHETLDSYLSHGISDDGLNSHLAGCMVNIYLSDKNSPLQFCGQGEIVHLLDSYAVLMTYWNNPIGQEQQDD